MEYHINADEKRIASFTQGTDRDICFDALEEYWGDEEIEFTTEDD